jgi:prepilin-type processing-associated H-X9-DG protein/prepilin-type N-terminal cleavage/methylation domain-containing protein
MNTLRIQQKDARKGFTVLELLVVAAVIGALAGILLPALISARESARRTHCVVHLREIGLAIQEYYDTSQTLPQSWKESHDRMSGYGWAVSIFPYLDANPVRQLVADKFPIAAQQNDAARNAELPFMQCPSDISETMFNLYAEAAHAHADDAAGPGSSKKSDGDVPIVKLPTASYAGVYGTIEADDTFPAPSGDGPIVYGRRVTLKDLERGQSHVVIVGERTMAMVPTTWLGVDFRGEDAACRLVGSAMTAPSCEFCDECEFSSRHNGGSNFVWADGHVTLVNSDIDPAAYRLLAKRRLE